MMLHYEDILQDEDICIYIQKADDCLAAQRFTEHSFAHVGLVARSCKLILESCGFPERTVELACIAALLHDIGNMVNREDHSQSGALLAFRLLEERHMEPSEIAEVVAAIGNHDEGNGVPVSPIAAALILADKSDVRRSRVREKPHESFDIHDRVNYSVTESMMQVENGELTLNLTIDARFGSVMDYFTIF